MNKYSDKFISEPIEPEVGTGDASAMSRGEPGLPAIFTWRARRYHMARRLHAWKQSGPSGCGERYLRRHWFEVQTVEGPVMTIYCLRQPPDARRAKSRWWLYSLRPAAGEADAAPV